MWTCPFKCFGQSAEVHLFGLWWWRCAYIIHSWWLLVLFLNEEAKKMSREVRTRNKQDRFVYSLQICFYMGYAETMLSTTLSMAKLCMLVSHTRKQNETLSMEKLCMLVSHTRKQNDWKLVPNNKCLLCLFFWYKIFITTPLCSDCFPEQKSHRQSTSWTKDPLLLFRFYDL